MMRVIGCCVVLACSAPAKPGPATAPTKAEECRQDGPAIDFHEIEVYCRHVADRCCGGGYGQWGCNNVNYVAWYGAYCAH